MALINRGILLGQLARSNAIPCHVDLYATDQVGSLQVLRELVGGILRSAAANIWYWDNAGENWDIVPIGVGR